MSLMKRITIYLNEGPHYGSLVRLVPLLQKRQLQLRYDVRTASFSMFLDGEQVSELRADKYLICSQGSIDMLVDSVLGMAFDCDYLDVSLTQIYAYGCIDITAKGKRLKVEIDHRREFEKLLFERRYLDLQTVLDHRGFGLFTQLLLNQPLHVQSFEDLWAVLCCLEIEELSVNKELHNDSVVVANLKHRSSIPQVQLEQHAQTLILSYLRHTTDLQAVRDHMQNPNLSEDQKLSQVRLSLYVSDMNHAHYSKIVGSVLTSPGAHIHQCYLVDFVR